MPVTHGQCTLLSHDRTPECRKSKYTEDDLLPEKTYVCLAHQMFTLFAVKINRMCIQIYLILCCKIIHSRKRFNIKIKEVRHVT